MAKRREITSQTRKKRMRKKQQEAEGSLTKNGATQLNVLAFPNVPHGIRPQSFLTNSGRRAFKYL